MWVAIRGVEEAQLQPFCWRITWTDAERCWRSAAVSSGIAKPSPGLTSLAFGVWCLLFLVLKETANSSFILLLHSRSSRTSLPTWEQKGSGIGALTEMSCLQLVSGEGPRRMVLPFASIAVALLGHKACWSTVPLCELGLCSDKAAQ